MNSLMYPAIAMMNRLSFGMKFSLISVLFFLPMLVTNYYLVKESYDTFIDTRNELNGLDVLSAGIKLRQQLEHLNDLYQIHAEIGQTGQAEQLAAQIEEAQADINAALDRLASSSDDAQHIDAFNAQRDAIKNALAAVQTESSLFSKAGLIVKALDNAEVLIKLVASQPARQA